MKDQQRLQHAAGNKRRRDQYDFLSRCERSRLAQCGLNGRSLFGSVRFMILPAVRKMMTMGDLSATGSEILHDVGPFWTLMLQRAQDSEAR